MQWAVIVLRDLGEIKQLEAKVRRSEKLAAIGKLAAGVAHEIRNPLSSIRGFAQFLSKGLKDSPKEQEFANTMVADDEPSHRQMIEAVLAAEGYEVTQAEDGQAAISAVEEKFYDLVIMDVRMPNVDGIQALQKIKQISPDIPVFLNEKPLPSLGYKLLFLKYR